MKTILYLGTDPTQFLNSCHIDGHLIHYPVIQIVPRPLDHPEIKCAYDDLSEYTHFIFTSKNTVKVFSQHVQILNQTLEKLNSKTVIAIGEVTALHLTAQGLSPSAISQNETQEGLVSLLTSMNLEDAYVFLPRSSLSRPVLAHFFHECQIRYRACDLYDTVPYISHPLPDLHQVDEIIFTSPSTVRAFFDIFHTLPSGVKCVAIGPVTQQSLSFFI